MLTFLDALKRFVVGAPEISGAARTRPMRTSVALPALSANALSSLAYAPDEIIITLAMAGLAATSLAPGVGVAVAVVMMVLVLCYRIAVKAYPRGRGDYQIARENLGPRAGVVVGAALLVDLSLTVAVSSSAAAHYLSAAFPALRRHEVLAAGIAIVFLVLLSLRGLARGPVARAVPTLVFVALLVAVLAAGGIQALLGTLGQAPSASLAVEPDAAHANGLESFAGLVLVLRAFSTGSAAMTGIETPVTATVLMRPPRAKNAGIILLWLGISASVLTVATLLLSAATRVHLTDAPRRDLIEPGESAERVQASSPVLAQLTQAVFGPGLPVIVLSLATVLVLLAAGIAAFASFPRLAFYLASDGYLPRQLRTRGDRLGFSNGILLLGACSLVVVIATRAHVGSLVQLYVVGVFVAFLLSQWGMVRHWGQRVRQTPLRRQRASMRRKRVLALVGSLLSALVLLVVLSTRFLHGAWVALAAIALLSVGMIGIKRHYDAVDRELAIDDRTDLGALPARVHAMVLISTLRKPVLRAVAFARAARPQKLEAVMVDVDPEKTARTISRWDQFDLPVPLTILASPYRELAGPLMEHIRRVRADRPRDLVVVYIPEYVVGRWWEQLAHNQVGLRLKARLHFEPGVVVASVPWQLASTGRELETPDGLAPQAGEEVFVDPGEGDRTDARRVSGSDAHDAGSREAGAKGGERG